jgi:heat shock protein HslJ
MMIRVFTTLLCIVLLNITLFSGCIDTGPPAPPSTSLTDIIWYLNSYDDGSGTFFPPLDGTEITASFSDEAVSGSAGCNRYSASYTVEDKSMTIGQIAVTEMFCLDPDGVMAQETRFLEALQQTASYSIDTGQRALTLFDASGKPLLVFSQTPP